MLERVLIKNFRALQSVEVALKPITALIGSNDTGKTSFLHALGVLGNCFGLSVTDCFRLGTNSVVIEGWTQGGGAHGGIVYDPRQTPGVRDRDSVADVRTAISPTNYFRLSIDGVPTQERGIPEAHGTPMLQPNGSGLAPLFDYLLRRDRDRFELIQQAAREHVPGLREILIATPDADTRRIDLAVERDLLLPAASASTGVRLILFFIGLVYHPKPPKLILLEEPETGVHPKRLKDIMALLRAISTGKYGAYPAQVVLTTHSPYLLDSMTLDSDQVLVFKREADGNRTAHAVDVEGINVFLDEFKLGEVWYNEGEDGLVRKK